MSSYTARFLSILLLLLCSLTTSAAVRSRTADPGINPYYPDTTADQWIDVFESQGREIYDRRLETWTH